MVVVEAHCLSLLHQRLSRWSLPIVALGPVLLRRSRDNNWKCDEDSDARIIGGPALGTPWARLPRDMSASAAEKVCRGPNQLNDQALQAEAKL